MFNICGKAIAEVDGEGKLLGFSTWGIPTEGELEPLEKASWRDDKVHSEESSKPGTVEQWTRSEHSYI